MNKLGGYITKLMTIVIDSEQDQIVKDLALSELTRLDVDINEFIRKHTKDMFDKQVEQKEKQLLQEDKKNVKDK